MRADFDQEKKRAVNVATRSLERDLERLKADHTSEMEEMNDRHREQLSQNKKKQWVKLFFFTISPLPFPEFSFLQNFL